MNNVRGLYPPLYGAAANGGGGGSGGSIQVETLPDASLEHKDKIVQYTGATTETLTNGYFYKCVENTTYDWEETKASETNTEVETLPTASAKTIGTIYKVDDKYYQTVIVLTYSWDNIPVMEVESDSGITYSNTPHIVGTYNGSDLWEVTIFNPTTGSWNAWADSNTVSVNNIVSISGVFVDDGFHARSIMGSNDGFINNVFYQQQYGVYIEVASGHTISRVNQVTIQYVK